MYLYFGILIKEDVAHIYDGILAIKRYKTGSFVQTWVDPESVIQSEVSQREENKHHVLMTKVQEDRRSFVWNFTL